MERIGINDFRLYKGLSELSYSPDGKKLAFVARQSKESGKGYDANIYIYDIASKETKQLTSLGDSATYMWLDDNNLIFPGVRGDKKPGTTDFYKISLDGGEAKKMFTIPMPVMQIKKIDGENFAFVAKYDHNKERLMKMTPEQREEEKDYIIIDELPFWFNGAGFINKTRKVLYTYNIPSGKVTQVANKWSDVMYVGIFGDKIFYTCTTYKDKKPKTNELHCYNIKENKDEKLIAGGKYSINSAGIAFGKVCVLLSDCKSYGTGEICDFYFLEDGKLTRFHEAEFGYNNSVGSDTRGGGGITMKYTDKGIYTTKGIHTNGELHVIREDGSFEVIVNGEGTVDMFDIKDGVIHFIGMRGQKLQELYDVNCNQLTTLNEKALEGKYVAVPEVMNIISDDTLIEGFVMKPINFDPDKKYPAIVDVHGGPRTIYGSVFFHEMQYWASEGYFVYFCNPRGSDGRGDDFADLRGKYGTIDFDDLLRFCDAVEEKYPQIDKTKVGITGGSYGGFMTNWAIGNTNRFAAAASQRSLTNWISLTNLADIGYTFDADQVQGTAWRNMKRIWDQSPLKHANKAKTPTLFIHSEEDYRCLLSEGMQMFYAIKNAGCVARMCIFKGENHELSRNGKPIHRTRRLAEITGWFDHYLKGIKK